MAVATAFQTIGPYWHLFEDAAQADLTRFGASGEKLTLVGKITDGTGAVVTDTAVEIFQASPASSETFPGGASTSPSRSGRRTCA